MSGNGGGGVKREGWCWWWKKQRSDCVGVMRTVKPLSPAVAEAYPDNTVINSRYKFYNFIFLNFYEQFRRPINFYFLLVACLQFIPVIAPVSPLSTLLPLLLAFSLTALKEGVDDIKRHRQDTKYNNTERTVLDFNTASWQTRLNCQIRVGDVILLKENEEIPCDVVVVAANDSTVFIRTDNLDGELDLKPREIVVPYAHRVRCDEVGGPSSRDPNLIYVDDECDALISKLANVVFVCPPPSACIESFDGRAEFLRATDDAEGDAFERHVPMSHLHLLPQACMLKKTKVALCVAVYTGEETKCGMNKHPAPVKWARIDKDVSRYAIFLFICQLVIAVVFGLTGYFINNGIEKKFWYLQVPSNESSVAFLIYPLRFFLLTTVMIPISFKFAVDISKYYMAMTVEWDEAMKHDEFHGMGCQVKNSSILEDLGQIDYLFSDKTGTLTENIMQLVFVTIGDTRIFLREDGQEIMDEGGSGSFLSNEKLHFGRILSLCNTVDTVESSDFLPNSEGCTFSPQYQASSPDEEALCRGSARLGVKLVHRDSRTVLLDVKGTQERWIIHHVFHFSSVQKSMGVIVENGSTGEIFYFVKGADDRIMEMAKMGLTETTSVRDLAAVLENEKLRMELITSHLHFYATSGLRTLLLAEKRLTREDLDAFIKQVKNAELSLQNRREELLELRAKMETGVFIVGITAIEDKLQNGVQETMCDFRRAGVKVWMLTGDKMQTAMQIGLSCGLYSAKHRKYVISGSSSENGSWENYLMSIPIVDLQNENKNKTRETLEGEYSSPGSIIINNERMYGLHMLLGGGGGGPDVPLSDESLLHNGMLFGTSESNQSVLVVDGTAVLERILNTPLLRDRFFLLGDLCTSVICARIAPSQKAAVTSLVRSKGFMTLSVGDGGNDVAMLQEAHVGVGIIGKEGQQAARAADFVITRFSDLRALVFVHGHWSYTRTAFIIKYSFYKSMLISITQLICNIVGMYMSGGSFWNSLGLTLWNGLYTLPQTLFYCLDRVAPRRILEQHTFLYKLTRSAKDINICGFFLMFVLRGALQSVLVFFIVLVIFGPQFAFADNGWAASNDVTFTVAYSSLIILQVFTLLLESHTITFLNAFWIFGMPVIYVAVTATYSCFSKFQFFGVWNNTINLVSFFTAFGVAAAVFFPFLGLIVVRRVFYPDARDVLRTVSGKNVWCRKVDYSCGRHLSRLSRWLFCLPEERSSLLSTSLGSNPLEP